MVAFSAMTRPIVLLSMGRNNLDGLRMMHANFQSDRFDRSFTVDVPLSGADGSRKRLGLRGRCVTRSHRR